MKVAAGYVINDEDTVLPAVRQLAKFASDVLDAFAGSYNYLEQFPFCEASRGLFDFLLLRLLVCHSCIVTVLGPWKYPRDSQALEISTERDCIGDCGARQARAGVRLFETVFHGKSLLVSP